MSEVETDAPVKSRGSGVHGQGRKPGVPNRVTLSMRERLAQEIPDYDPAVRLLKMDKKLAAYEQHLVNESLNEGVAFPVAEFEAMKATFEERYRITSTLMRYWYPGLKHVQLESNTLAELIIQMGKPHPSEKEVKPPIELGPDIGGS